MPEECRPDPLILGGVALQYPEQTFYLAQVFNDTTNSYKLLWFLAILSLLRRTEDRSFLLTDIFIEMVVAAWHPVCLYRLSLGRQDKLQNTITDVKDKSGLPPNADPGAVRKFLCECPDARKKLQYFKRYVPTRFLTPWFSDILRGERDDTVRTRKIQRMAKNRQRTASACLYYFEGSAIRLNDSWRLFLLENLGIVQGFAEHQLALYLQTRNPNVPGIVNKLRAPAMRQLTSARHFWRLVRIEFDQAGKTTQFRDIYSERPIHGTFSIDHFLPWSFVAHDLLWNLAPVEATTNSRKGDSVPDLDLYLPRLVKLHVAAMQTARHRPALLEDYTDCFKQDVAALITLDEPRLLTKYREVILPQAQIAINQGFPYGWRLGVYLP